jgi:cytochrome P450
MQKDMLAPQSAREYVPSILRAAANASPKGAEWADRGDILRFLHYCALDMFSSVHFGSHNEMSKDDYDAFCDAAVTSMQLGIKINRDPLVRLACAIGWQTPTMRRFTRAMDTVHEIARRRQAKVLDRIESGQVTDKDKETYFYKSLQRLNESDISLGELIEIGIIIMHASVDTTSTKTAWNVLQLAVNPDKQEALREEIRRSVVQEGGMITAAALETPYLKAFIRETHRCTPIGPMTLIKELAMATEIHGVELPAGSLVAFDAFSHQFNPDIVDDPMSFLPERWLPDAVEARKGTPAAIVDHPFFSGPFSQGARRCPGSRVAYLEVQVLLAQLLLDWHIDCPVPVHWSDVKSSLESMVVPTFPDGVRFVPRPSP